MQPGSDDPAPPRTGAEASSYARKAADQVYEEASASVHRVTERRVRYQEAVIRREIRQAKRENEEAAALEREQARLDAFSETEFMRDQIAPMLEDGLDAGAARRDRHYPRDAGFAGPAPGGGAPLAHHWRRTLTNPPNG